MYSRCKANQGHGGPRLLEVGADEQRDIASTYCISSQVKGIQSSISADPVHHIGGARQRSFAQALPRSDHGLQKSTTNATSQTKCNKNISTMTTTFNSCFGFRLRYSVAHSWSWGLVFSFFFLEGHYNVFLSMSSVAFLDCLCYLSRFAVVKPVFWCWFCRCMCLAGRPKGTHHHHHHHHHDNNNNNNNDNNDNNNNHKQPQTTETATATTTTTTNRQQQVHNK